MNFNKITVLIFLSMLCSIQINKGMHDPIDLTEEEARARARENEKLLNDKLIKAAITGNFEAAQEAINDGANVNYIDKYTGNNTPLTHATNYNRLNVAQLLIEKGADVNAKGSDQNISPLIYAIAKGNLEMVKLLLDNNANISLTSKSYDVIEDKIFILNALERADLLENVTTSPEKKLKYKEIADYIRNYKAQREKAIKEGSSLLPEIIGLVEEYTGHKPAKLKSKVCDMED